jgi:uncharacterized protein (TIGR02147 family)
MLEATNYRDILRYTLLQRQKKNASYSLRAFARDISISPSRLSEIFKNSDTLSPGKALEIVDKLNLSPADRRYFLDLVITESPYGNLVTEIAQNRIDAYRTQSDVHTLEEEEFSLISNWYHLAIVEILEIPGFSGNLEWIAKRLGIHSKQVASSIIKLERLGIVTFEEGNVIKIHSRNRVSSPAPSRAIRSYHKQILDKAYEAIEGQDVYQRDLAAMTIAIDRENLPEIKRFLSAWRSEFRKTVSEENANPNAVYCLSMQFFDLTPEQSN